MDVEAFLSGQRVGRFHLVLVIVCGTMMFLDGLNTQVIGYLAPQIAKEWHLAHSALGPIFSIGLAGIMVGYLIFSPYSDRFGHKKALVISTFLFAMFTLLTALASNVFQLSVLRFLTGLGLGGAAPSAVALTSEYVPKRLRATFVLLIYCGFSFGFVVAGVMADTLLPRFGWRAMLEVAGCFSLVLIPVLLLCIPESIQFLIRKGTAQAQIFLILSRATKSPELCRAVIIDSRPAASEGFPINNLFQNNLSAGTIFIWIAFFLNLGVFYFLQSWLPTVLADAGWTPNVVVISTALTTVGGLAAAFVAGPLMDRINPYLVVATLFVSGAVFVAVMGATYMASPGILMLVAFFTGFCVSGGQKSGVALAAMFYPPKICSTGTGWALGISRAGGVIGPFLAGILFNHYPVSWSFYIAAVPMLGAAISTLAMNRFYGGKTLSRTDTKSFAQKNSKPLLQNLSG